MKAGQLLRGCMLPLLFALFLLVFIPTIFFPLTHTLRHTFTHADKTFPFSPPPPFTVWYAAHCSKTPERKIFRKANHMTALSYLLSSYHRCACVVSRMEGTWCFCDTSLHCGSPFNPQRLELMTVWSVVIPHKLPCAETRDPCLDRDCLPTSLCTFSLPLRQNWASMQASKARQAGRQEAGECLLQLSR